MRAECEPPKASVTFAVSWTVNVTLGAPRPLRYRL